MPMRTAPSACSRIATRMLLGSVRHLPRQTRLAHVISTLRFLDLLALADRQIRGMQPSTVLSKETFVHF
jgi:hypothetical protein